MKHETCEQAHGEHSHRASVNCIVFAVTVCHRSCRTLRQIRGTLSHCPTSLLQVLHRRQPAPMLVTGWRYKPVQLAAESSYTPPRLQTAPVPATPPILPMVRALPGSPSLAVTQPRPSCHHLRYKVAVHSAHMSLALVSSSVACKCCSVP